MCLDWTDRYPLIVETAHRIQAKHFVLDGEAVLSASTASPTSEGSWAARFSPSVPKFQGGSYAHATVAVSAAMRLATFATVARLHPVMSWI